MSQTYQCTLKESVQQTVRFGDTITHSLSLTPILPAEEMVDLLRAALQEAGLAHQGEDRWVMNDEHAITTVDLQQMLVQTELHQEETLSQDVTAHGWGWSQADAQAQAQAQMQQIQADARQDIQRGARKLQRQATQNVGETDEAALERLHQILQRVYAESLKQKARQLGEVTEVREGLNPQGEYELVIKVET